ncbi:MAG: NAD(P)H-dependent oxidoreductase subunit E, partial [Dehalococcoidia bacterium]|nr:NAD(P)H-dependent oxidoreductase subunit E [Dehalococcoidia bacterium]
VLTFYAQFRTKPTGKNRVMVCRGTACHVKGGPRVLRAVKQTLGLEEGESTADMKYTLETVACIGACALAPTMMINKDTHGRLTPQKVSAIFGGEKEEKK